MLLVHIVCMLHFLIYLNGSAYGQNVLGIYHNLTKETLQFKCVVDELIYNVDFILPDKSWGFAFCIAPTSLTKETGPTCECECYLTDTCGCNITQNVDKKTTTFVIEDSNLKLTQMTGKYECQHGSYSKSTIVRKPCKNDECQEDKGSIGDNISIGVLWMITICCIALCIYTRKDRIRKFVSHSCLNNEDIEGAERENVKFCCMCRYTTACQICIDCKTFYCDTCCDCHTRYEPEHRLCQIEHTLNKQTKTLCGKCNDIASHICTVTNCDALRCQSCNHIHDARYMIRIYQNNSIFRKKPMVDMKLELSYVKSIHLQVDAQPVRIYGLGYTEDDTLVVLDGNNHKLIVLTEDQEQFKKQFADEPCAMTVMTNSTIAITFPYIKWIRIYYINLIAKELIESEQSFSMDTLGISKYKPFNIAYSEDCFAIEVGEREDGKIVIVDISKKQIRRTILCNFAYYTGGHTIKLALDVNSELIYVSAMGRRMVTCMNFDGELMWNTHNASPRSILILEDTIILCSKKCNALYALEKENGKSVVLGGHISNPRFIAHRRSDNQLCVDFKTIDNTVTLACYILKVYEHSTQKTKLLPKNVNKQDGLANDAIFEL